MKLSTIIRAASELPSVRNTYDSIEINGLTFTSGLFGDKFVWYLDDIVIDDDFKNAAGIVPLMVDDLSEETLREMRERNLKWAQMHNSTQILCSR